MLLSIPSKLVMALVSFWYGITLRLSSAPGLALLRSSPGMDGQGRGAGPAKMFKVEQPEHDDSTLFHLY